MWIILLGRIVQFLLMLATLRIATTVLSPAEMGKIAIVTTTVAFISSFLISPVGMYVNRHLHGWQTNRVVIHYLKFHYAYVLLIAVLAALVVGGLCAYDVLDMHLPCSFVMLFVLLTIFFNTVNQTAIPSLNLLGFRGWFTVLSIATILLSLLFAVFMVIYFDAQSEYWLLGILMGQIVFALIGSLVFYEKTKRTPTVIPAQAGNPPLNSFDAKHEHALNQKRIQQRPFQTIRVFFSTIKQSQSVFQFGWPIAIAMGLTWFQSQSYRFFIEDAFGLSTLGLFVAGYGISAGIIAGFESVFATYFQPIFYHAISLGDESKRAEAWNHYAKAIVPSLVLVALTLSAVSSKLTLLMLAPQFQSAAAFVMWGALIETCRVMVSIYSMAAHAELDTKQLILPNLVGAGVAVTLMYALIPIVGLMSIGCALTCAGLAVVVFLHLKMKKNMALFLPKHEILRALSFGSMIWLVSRCCDFLVWDHGVWFTLCQMAGIGLLFVAAEFYLLKIRNIL